MGIMNKEKKETEIKVTFLKEDGTRVTKKIMITEKQLNRFLERIAIAKEKSEAD